MDTTPERTQRPRRPRGLALASVLAASLIAGVVALGTDTARTGPARYETGELPTSSTALDLQLASVVDGACGPWEEDLITDLITVQDDLRSTPSPTVEVCLRNVGTADGMLKLGAIDVIDADPVCSSGEAVGTCGPGFEAGGGELAPAIRASYGPCGGGAPEAATVAALDVAAVPVGLLDAGSEARACIGLVRVGSGGELQSDQLTWRFAFDLVDEDAVCPVDDSEDDDAPEDATPLAAPEGDQATLARGTVCTLGPADPDHWTFTHQGGPVDLRVLGADRTSSYQVPMTQADVTLTGPAGPVALSRNASGDVHVPSGDHPPGQYVLRVVAQVDGVPSYVSYVVALGSAAAPTVPDCSVDPYEPNSYFSPVLVSVPAAVEGAACAEDGIDSFGFTHSGGPLTVSVTGSPITVAVYGQGISDITAEVDGTWEVSDDFPPGSYFIDLSTTSAERTTFTLTVD